MPYSQQFKFVFLATNPFMPRWLACWLINSWMTSLYKRCGIAFMGPAQGSAFNFTGQCNDAFFQLAVQVCATFVISLPSFDPVAESHLVELLPSRRFWFLLQGKVTYLVDRIKSAHGKKLTLESGAVLPADILVNARERSLKCSMQAVFLYIACAALLHGDPVNHTVCVLCRGL